MRKRCPVNQFQEILSSNNEECKKSKHVKPENLHFSNFFEKIVKGSEIIDSSQIIFVVIRLSDGRYIYEWFKRGTKIASLKEFVKSFLAVPPYISEELENVNKAFFFRDAFYNKIKYTHDDMPIDDIIRIAKEFQNKNNLEPMPNTMTNKVFIEVEIPSQI